LSWATAMRSVSGAGFFVMPRALEHFAAE